MRVFVSVVAVAALGVLAACSPKIPDSAAGFSDSPFDPQSSGEPVQGQTITGDPLVPAAAVSSESLTPVADPLPTVASNTLPAETAPDPVAVMAAAASGPSDDLAQQTAAALAASQTSAATPTETTAPISNPGISDENDFAAVSQRETIQSDAERIALNKAQYLVVQPTDLPERSGSGQPNIVSYALQTGNPRGTRIYSRAGINMQARMQRNCAEYPSADQAQIAFLARGGPKRDRLGLDPDGDGYACSWDPAPFRSAVKN